MAFALFSRVHETTITTGTGALTLAGAVSGKRTFASAYANADTMLVTVTMGTDWETFLGTFTSAGNTITRTTMFRSTNANAAVNWGAGTKDIFVAMLGPSELNSFTKSSVLIAMGEAFDGYGYGCTLSNDPTDATNDIGITTGVWADSTAVGLMRLVSSLIKRLDAAWVVGTNQGGLDTGAVANGTYHVHLIMRVDTGVVDVLFSLSATAPTMPANYTLFRRIGSIVRVSAAIKAFIQNNDVFMWQTPAADISVTNPGAAAVTRTLTLPLGIKVLARLFTRLGQSAATDAIGAVYLSDLAGPDIVAGSNAVYYNYVNIAGFFGGGGSAEVVSNTSAQIRSRLEGSGAGSTLVITTLGWVDMRGKLTP